MDGFEHVESIDGYLSDIEKFNPIAGKEEIELGNKINFGDKSALDKLIRANLKFVVSVAKQYRGKGVPFEDLIEEGNIGLITAAMRFKPEKGCKFITYAVFWIKLYINKAISDAKSHELKNNDFYERVKKEAPSVCDEEELILKNISASTAVEDITSCLKERELQMISMYFGLNGEKESTYKEIGKRFGVTSECARQTVNASISKMKRNAVCSSSFSEYSKI